MTLARPLGAEGHLFPESQAASTQSNSGTGWTVWLRDADGNLISRRDDATGGTIWTGHGKVAGVSVHSNGVAATGYLSAGTPFQHVMYVDTSGWVVHRQFEGSTENTAKRFRVGPPTGETLTGRVAASWSYSDAGTRYLRLFASTSDGSLWALRVNAATLATLWGELEGAGIHTTNPLAASASPARDFTRVFASSSGGNIWTYAYDGDAWTFESLGKPSGVSAGGTISAAEEQIDGTNYRSYVFCTKTGAADNRLFYARALDADGGYVWQAPLTLPVGQAVRNTGYAITSIARPDGVNRAIDVWVLNNDSTLTKLYHAQKVTGAGEVSALADLGQDGETGLKRGGLAAMPFPSAFKTYVFFHGAVGSAYRLYRRIGHEGYSGATPNTWANHQSGVPMQRPLDSLPPHPHAESVTAYWHAGGRVASVAQVTTSGELPKIELSWSTSDGDAWSDPVLVEFPMLGVTPERGADPTVDFTDDGTAHIVALPADYDVDACGGGFNWQHVAHRSTSDGSTFSAVTPIDNSASADHPWVGVERIAGANDKIHFVWGDDVDNEPRYRVGTWNGTLDITSPVVDLDEDDPDDIRPGPRVSVGASGSVWVVWLEEIDADVRLEVCHLNATRDACIARKTLDEPVSPTIAHLDIPHTIAADTIRCTHGFSIRASQQDPGVLYYVYAKRESDGDHLDVFSNTILDFFGEITVGDPVHITTVWDDDHDQFCPAVTSSRDGSGTEKVFANWYDRSGNLCNGVPNSCYQVKRSVSFDQGGSFQHTQLLAGGIISDPTRLGLRCASSDYFLGDYNEVVGDLLHSAHVVVTSEFGSPPDTSDLDLGWVSGGYYYW